MKINEKILKLRQFIISKLRFWTGIDKLVYELYGLTEEEIRVVEGKRYK